MESRREETSSIFFPTDKKNGISHISSCLSSFLPKIKGKNKVDEPTLAATRRHLAEETSGRSDSGVGSSQIEAGILLSPRPPVTSVSPTNILSNRSHVSLDRGGLISSSVNLSLVEHVTPTQVLSKEEGHLGQNEEAIEAGERADQEEPQGHSVEALKAPSFITLESIATYNSDSFELDKAMIQTDTQEYKKIMKRFEKLAKDCIPSHHYTILTQSKSKEIRNKG